MNELNAMKKFISEVWNSPNQDRFPGPQPVSIERKHFTQLKNRPYVVCEKTDGVRHMLACFMDGDKKICVLVDRCFNYKHTTLCVPRNTLLDGELIGDAFVVHDVMMVRGVNVMHETLLKRLEYARDLKIPKTPGNPRVIIKTMYPLNELHKIKLGEYTDGLIFTPVNERVRMGTHETMFKWKPREHITIDFKVDSGLLYIQNGDCVGQYRGYIKEHEGCIVECGFDGGWVYTKTRRDKDFPNNKRTYDRTLVNIQENINLKEFLCIV